MTGTPYTAVAAMIRRESNAPAQSVQPCGTLEHDEQFLLRDKFTGRPLAAVRYRIEGAGQVVVGRTDQAGYTARVSSGANAAPLTVYLIEEDAGMLVSTVDGSGCI